ncbi:MAG: L-amino acid N-acetyltransferase AaaT [Anaerolineae bacterium]|nr:L-amino acid N-acetyltransferase AaaT [Anaerolineae bacterium]
MKVIIRAITMSDLEDVLELRSMPKAQQETLQLPFPSREALREQMENRSPQRWVLVAEAEDSGKVVGTISVTQSSRSRQAHTATIGMAVHDDYHNRGIGSKLLAAAINLAENWLNVSRVELTVFVDNPAAIHLYEKHGFVREGRLRRYAFKNGQFADVFIMARIKE